MLLHWLASFAKSSKRKKNDPLSTCNCQSWDKCEWSNETVNTMSTLPANSEAFKSNEAFFKKMICDEKSKKVYCCNRKAPTMSQMKILAEVFYYVYCVSINYSVKNSTVDCKIFTLFFMSFQMVPLNNQLYWHFLYCFGFDLKKIFCRKSKCLQ